MHKHKVALMAAIATFGVSSLLAFPTFSQSFHPAGRYSSLQVADNPAQQVTLSPAGQVYRQVANSVVAISTYGQPSAVRMEGLLPFGFPDNLFPPSPGQPEQRRGQGELRPQLVPLGGGSGFVISRDGHIVTNAHVIDGAERIEVNFLDGTIVRAEVVGVDNASDIAVLRVDLPAEQLQPVTFADSDVLTIGEDVVAIGSPFGQRWTLTEGIVSALDRSITGLTVFSIGGVIQTDAAINPGNSGGPLLNLRGEVIGVNSQISTNSGANTGIGYAVPSNLVQRVAKTLITVGHVEYSYLGISGSDVSLVLIEQFGLPNNFRGVAVQNVNDDSPAQAAGLRRSGGLELLDGLLVPSSVDIITAINGYRLRGIADLIEYLAIQTRPGDRVTLEVMRDGTETINLEVTLAARPF